MGYVLPTLVAMGFGYAISELALKQPLVGLRWAWAGFWLVIAGTVMAATPIALGLASVLYTFYPPMIGSPFYYLGVVLVVVGSWIWVALMAINLRAWKKENAGATGAAGDVRQCGRRVPLGVDLGGRGGRDPLPDPARRARA